MSSQSQPLTKQTSTLLKQVEEQVIDLFKVHQIPALPYHNYKHTHQVVKAVQEMAIHYQLEETQYLILMVSAWFHDVGYLFTPLHEHEEKSVELATTFLQSHDVSQAIIKQVQACIRATRMPQMPQNLMEEIICDADLFHLGSKAYPHKSKLLRKEMQLLTGKKIPKCEWQKDNIAFLQSHHYFTTYTQLLLEKNKEHNLFRLREKQKDHTLTDEPFDTNCHNYLKAKSEKRLEQKQNKLDRDVTTFLRITSSNHINLSEMADRKARIMISVNSILVSVIVTFFMHRLHENNYLLIPTLLFLTTAVITIIFSVLATRPTVGRSNLIARNSGHKKGELLFFGNFYKMKLEEYKAEINMLISERDFLYESLIEDIYRMGEILAKKYKLLRFAYSIFMIGFVLSVLAFSVAIILFR